MALMRFLVFSHGVSMSNRIRIAISACLLGRNVRYDGRSKAAPDVLHFLCKDLDIEWVVVCPEHEAGLTVPRDPMRLVRGSGGIKLVAIETAADHTAIVQQWIEARLPLLEREYLCGFVLKARSPSCGVHDAEIVEEHLVDQVGHGAGLFAAAVMQRFPGIPVADEELLRDASIRSHFLERVFAIRFSHSACRES